MKETVVVVSVLTGGSGARVKRCWKPLLENSCCFDQDWGIGRQARVKVPLNENKEKQEQVLKLCLIMRFRDLSPRQQSEVELERALNRADILHNRGRELLFQAVNKVVDLQNEYKANMGEVEVAAAAAVFDMAQAENDSTVREILELQVVSMLSLAEFDVLESRNFMQQYWDLAEQSASKLHARADKKSKAACKLFESRVEEMSSQENEKKGAFFWIL